MFQHYLIVKHSNTHELICVFPFFVSRNKFIAFLHARLFLFFFFESCCLTEKTGINIYYTFAWLCTCSNAKQSNEYVYGGSQWKI